MKFNLFLICIFAECLGTFVTAQTNETIPSYHWAYPYINELRLNGYLPALHTIRQPYTAAEVENSLSMLQRQLERGEVKASAHDRWLIDLLSSEFLHREQLSDQKKQLTISPGVWLEESMIHDSQDARCYTQMRSQVGVHWKDRLSFYNGIRLDQLLLDDPLYPGKRWRGFAGYTEQAYVRFSIYDLRSTNLNVGLTLGRDFLHWGSGRTGRLLFSDYAQPLDQLKLDFAYKGLRFYVLAAQLEKWQLADSLVKKYGTRRANRFLSAHGVTFAIKDKLFIGLTEALVYGGPDAHWELKYHNPMLYYHGELLNGGGSDGNGLLYLDVDWYPWRNWRFYGEVLVDDYQLEKTVPGDLEPTEWGLILGWQRSSILGLSGSQLGLEYVRIANRTYNSWQDWEKFVHFNRPIGYALGNNFDRWNLSVSHWLWRGVQIGLEWDFIRQGQGSVLDRWDTPWKNFTLAQGYDEPFPYGIVESSSNLSMKLRYHFLTQGLMECLASYQQVDNFGHRRGQERHGWTVVLRAQLDVAGHWKY
ncbi:MAG: capsule assembly Wzi family protein [candidate division KSB1 bacterium]|nr:capsule assembly Wzi family protein [candidate division KSB1 bacterium]MDZ7319734.1 capsule assembly Wzi family protein [candidate division KSB1 bacterium]